MVGVTNSPNFSNGPAISQPATPTLVTSDQSVGGTPFSATLLNAVSVAGAGPSFVYPGGRSTVNVIGLNFNGAVVTIRYSVDGGATWNVLSGDYSSFAAAGQMVISALQTGFLLDAFVTGTPTLPITVTVGR